MKRLASSVEKSRNAWGESRWWATPSAVSPRRSEVLRRRGDKHHRRRRRRHERRHQQPRNEHGRCPDPLFQQPPLPARFNQVPSSDVRTLTARTGHRRLGGRSRRRGGCRGSRRGAAGRTQQLGQFLLQLLAPDVQRVDFAVAVDQHDEGDGVDAAFDGQRVLETAGIGVRADDGGPGQRLEAQESLHRLGSSSKLTPTTSKPLSW